ncbi:MAG: NUDIX hydrolase [Ornithinimicrobium sp.]
MTMVGAGSSMGAAGEAATVTYRDFDMPRSLRAAFQRSAVEWLDGAGRPTAATPRLSASALLLRETATGLEVFAQRRVPQMAFAPGMLVYPGGAVDPRDGEGEIDWERISPARSVDQWAHLLGADPAQTRLILFAVTRELFEECGVLIAGPDQHTVLDDLSDPRWQRHREALLNRSVSFAKVLVAEGLTLRTDLLAPVGHWITPECEPRRYDTYFFAATLPVGQHADGRTTEAVTAGWVEAAEALQEHRAGPGTMMPPTQVLAETVADATDLKSYFARPHSMQPVLPSPARVAGALVMRAPIPATQVASFRETD